VKLIPAKVVLEAKFARNFVSFVLWISSLFPCLMGQVNASFQWTGETHLTRRASNPAIAGLGVQGGS